MPANTPAAMLTVALSRRPATGRRSAISLSASPHARYGTQTLRGWLGAGLITVLGSACGGKGGQDPATPSVIAPSTQGTPNTVNTVVTVRNGLSHPWALAFLPDGSMLVTERSGQLRHLSADGLTLSAPISGLPAVAATGQGGLLDVQIDPDFASTRWVYWSYAEAGTGAEAGLAGTAVARGQLNAGATALSQVQVIFRQKPKVAGTGHFGSRLVFGTDKNLFIALGERQQDDPARPGLQNAQNLLKHLGKVVRIARDGSVPAGNPSFNVAGALPEIWSLGHRNAQGAALNPATGELWVAEHGPQGGDEINRVQAGHNYGWPLRSYGCPYGSPVGEACRVGGGTHAPDFDEPLTYWVPTSTAPSGMAFYTGSRYPDWQGHLFVGSLAGQTLWHLTLNGNVVTGREALFTNQLGRIRDVRQGPDGWLYLLTDDENGKVLRIER
jgi:glucose/arabinose dehydrogenase